MIAATLLLVWEQRIGAVCPALLAALFFSAAAQLHCDIRSLQVLDLIEKQQANKAA
jgi:hypothetical protein